MRNRNYVVILIVAAALLAPYGPGIRARAASTSRVLDRSIHAVASAYSLVEKNFADPVSSEKAFYGDQGRGGAIPACSTRSIRTPTSWIPPSTAEMQRRQHAQYYGVGMQITMDQQHTVVMEPFVNSRHGTRECGAAT